MNRISHRKTKKRPMLKDWVIVSVAITSWNFAVKLYRDWFYHSCLELVHEIIPRSQGYPGACEIHYLIKNTGKAQVAGPVIEMSVIKPRRVPLGCGPLFNEEIGKLQSQPRSEFIPLPEKMRGNTYTFRLNVDIPISPGLPSLMIAKFIVYAHEETPTEEIDHELKWTTYSTDKECHSDHVRISGDILKAIILKQWEKP